MVAGESERHRPFRDSRGDERLVLSDRQESTMESM